MHEYLLGLKTGIHCAEQATSGFVPGLIGHDSLGHTARLVLLVMGAATWFLITYAAPLMTVLRSPLAGPRAWLFAVY